MANLPRTSKERNVDGARVIRLLLSFALLAAVIWYLGGIGDIGQLMRSTDPWLILVAFAIATLDRVLMAYKWCQLLRSRGIHFSTFQGLKAYCTASIYGLFLPTTVGADAIRTFIVSRAGYAANNILASIIVERMIGFIASLLVGMVALLILYQSHLLDSRFDPVWGGAGAAVGLGVILFALSFSRKPFDLFCSVLPKKIADSKIVARLRRLHDAYIDFHAEKKAVGRFFLLTIVEQFFPALVMWAIAVAVGAEVGMVFMAGVVPLTLLIARIPVSVAGLGVFEAIFATLMSLSGVPSAEALTIALIGRVIGILVLIPWWLAYVWQTGSFKTPVDAVSK